MLFWLEGEFPWEEQPPAKKGPRWVFIAATPGCEEACKALLEDAKQDAMRN
jgi:hypothetical protein